MDVWKLDLRNLDLFEIRTDASPDFGTKLDHCQKITLHSSLFWMSDIFGCLESRE